MSAGEVSLWRIAKDTREYRADDLSGGGAKITGGRWNSKGRPVVYASTSIALSALETLVHRGDNLAIRNAFLVRLTVPQSVWKLRDQVGADELEPTWLAEPAGSTTICFGDDWLDHVGAPLLMVPSVIVPEEFNVLLNPAHPAAVKIKAVVVRRFIYDRRL